MQIDWLTVAAQVVNFLVLVFLLRRFLYRPVVEAMARRERRIAERMADAAEREKAATERKAEYTRELDALMAVRDERIAAAERDAEAERHKLLEEARAGIVATEARWRADLARDQREFVGEIKGELAASAQAIARHALRDLADANLEAQVIARFLDEAAALGADERRALAADAEGITVITAFGLEPAQQATLTRKLHEVFAKDVPIRYEISDEPLCGIELRGADRRMAWSFAEYLEPVSRRIEERLASAPEDGKAA
jgi:F-type H+-transporting ATPase subunit b